MGLYCEAGGITLYHGDCMDVLPILPPVDAVIADPPYNAGLDYDTHDDAMAPDAYEAWCAEWFGALATVPTPAGLKRRTIIFPGHGNLGMWFRIQKPSGVACWYKPGNPARGGVFQFCEWEPVLLYGSQVGGSDVIRCPINRQQDTGNHPCPKPLGLMTALIEKVKPYVVLDPFAGSGSTLLAARMHDVSAIGIEKSERYCEIIATRLAQGDLFAGQAS